MKAILIRTSTDEQNPQSQLKDIESISGEDYILFEEQQSAWKDEERKVIDDLKQAIKQNKVTDLFVWDFDRLYRNRQKFKEFLLFLKAYNVKLHSYRQQWFEDLYKIPSPWNEIVLDLMINIYGHIAEDESRKKSDRVKISIRRDSGITKSYKGNKWGRHSLPFETKQLILEAYRSGKTYSQICNEVFYWDKSRNKKYVSKGFVHKLLREEQQEENRNLDVQKGNN